MTANHPETANLLGQETSPYLLQHRDNPVHWRPWGSEAFTAARVEAKPILLSIGYAACHWCHVMAHESFEDERIAALINRDFIAIKVDREERPDVDAVYQKALSLMGEQGGWPLTMFITPDGDPFWGGTYFPPHGRWGRPGFTEVLEQVAAVWTGKPASVARNAALLRAALDEDGEDNQGGGQPAPALTPDLAARAGLSLLRHLDPVEGGFAGAPKFPMASAYGLLWRLALRLQSPELRDAVLLTLTRMSQGGLYDHLGGGFARYATDTRWLVPHFEKMLYDNAQLVALLTAAWALTGDRLYAARVAETIDWLDREMGAEAGAFAATQDADSEGEEGRYYVWRAKEVRDLLGSAYPLFARVYDLSSAGNWEDGKTILHRNHADGAPGSETEEAALAAARATLKAARDLRVAPGRDDKVLADWNGLMIAALARAAVVFDRPAWLAMAERAFAGVVSVLGSGDGGLVHAARAGKRVEAGFLDDYAAMAHAALALFEATGQATYLTRAEDWVARADALFSDHTGGWRMTAHDAADLPTRPPAVSDAATPSGAALLCDCLARLALLTGNPAWLARAERGLDALSGAMIGQFPHTAALFSAFLMAADGALVVVAGDPADPRSAALAAAALGSPDLDVTVLRVIPGQDVPPGHPAAGKTAVARPTAFICRGQTCGLPLTTAQDLRAALERR